MAMAEHNSKVTPHCVPLQAIFPNGETVTRCGVRRLFVGIPDSTLFVAGESGEFHVFQAIFVDICPQKAGCHLEMGLVGLANVNRRIRNSFSHDQSSHPPVRPSLTVARVYDNILAPIGGVV